MAFGYLLLNPHLGLELVVVEGGPGHKPFRTSWKPVDTGWRKWQPSRPTSAYWYDAERLAGLIAGYLGHDRDTGDPAPRLVRDFLALFDGMSSTAKRKQVLDATGLQRATLRDLLGDDGLDMGTVRRLLDAMRAQSTPVKAARLGAIGREHLAARFVEQGVHPESFQYKQLSGTTAAGRPWLVEAAFGYLAGGGSRHVFSGVNWSIGLQSPFRSLRWAGDGGLDSLLTGNRVAPDDPVLVCVHLITPGAAYTDRGKSAVSLTIDVARAITDAVHAVTKAWEAQKKREERDAAAAARREELLTASARPKRMSIKAAAFLEMHKAYLKASAANTLPANARQIMYAARGAILRLTGRKDFSDAYFTQTLLPLFVQLNPELTADWDVIYDARGHLLEPHTRREVALGTLEVRHYTGARPQPWLLSSGGFELFRWKTVGPKHRFAAVLFIEKEGFDQIILSSGLLKRFDIALMSTKGMSVIAARQLVEHWAKNNPDVLVLVAHDFDVSGFTIFGTLGGDTWRHTYQTPPNVIDIGLRLADVEAWELESESVAYKGAWDKIAATLRRHGATEDEIEFLRGEEVAGPSDDTGAARELWEDEEEDEEDGGKKPKKPRVNCRVELNAFTSDKFIDWLESKIKEHGIAKVVPDDETLNQAFRAAWQVEERNQVLAAAEKRIGSAAENLSLPDDLRERVETLLAEEPERPWDEALAEVVAEHRRTPPPAPPPDGPDDPNEPDGPDDPWQAELDERVARGAAQHAALEQRIQRLQAENPDMTRFDAVMEAFAERRDGRRRRHDEED